MNRILDSFIERPDPPEWLRLQAMKIRRGRGMWRRLESTRMIGELQLARWPHVRIPAIGEDWIEADWAPTLRLLDS